MRMTKLVERLEKPSTAYGMEISAEKTKLMTNNKEIKIIGINTEWHLHRDESKWTEA